MSPAATRRTHSTSAGAGDVAKDHAAKSLLQIGAGGLVVLGDDDAAAAHGLKQHAQAGQIGAQEAANRTMEPGKVVMAWCMRSRSVH